MMGIISSFAFPRRAHGRSACPIAPRIAVYPRPLEVEALLGSPLSQQEVSALVPAEAALEAPAAF
jgi:hypothetical protein